MAWSLALRIILGIILATSATPTLACRWPVNTPLPNYTVGDLDRVLAAESPVIFAGTVESSNADGVVVRNEEAWRGEAPPSFLFEAIVMMRCFYPDTEYRFSDFQPGDDVIVFGGHDAAGGFVPDELVLKDSRRGQHLLRLTSRLHRSQAQ